MAREAIICPDCGRVVVPARANAYRYVAPGIGTMRRVIKVLDVFPDGLRRNELRSAVGSAYRANFSEALARLEAEGRIMTSDHRIKIKEVEELNAG